MNHLGVTEPPSCQGAPGCLPALCLAAEGITGHSRSPPSTAAPHPTSPNLADSPGGLHGSEGVGDHTKVGWGCWAAPHPHFQAAHSSPYPLRRDLRGLQSGGSGLHGRHPHVPAVQGAVRHLGHALRERDPGEHPHRQPGLGWGEVGRAEQAPSKPSCLPAQVLSNLVMEELLPELRSTIGPRLKGKAPERQRTWIQVWGWGCPGGGGVPTACHPPPPLADPAWGGLLSPAGILLLPPSRGPFQRIPPFSAVVFKAPSAPLPSPARPRPRCRVPGAREANRRKPSPGAKPVPAKFSEPFLEQRGLNPAQTLAKD